MCKKIMFTKSKEGKSSQNLFRIRTCFFLKKMDRSSSFHSISPPPLHFADNSVSIFGKIAKVVLLLLLLPQFGRREGGTASKDFPSRHFPINPKVEKREKEKKTSSHRRPEP